jgi:chromosome segregation ATPase
MRRPGNRQESTLMARPTKAPQTAKSAVSTRKPGRPAATPAKTPATRTKAPAAAKPTRTAASPAAPKLSKDELRTRVEALERANATLRTKNKDANRAAKTAAARIAELEDQVAELEKRAASAQRQSAASPRRRRSREIDPGDSVPEGVAVQTPEPLDEAAETALENLNENLQANRPE